MKSIMSRVGVFAVLASVMAACVGAEDDIADQNDGADSQAQPAESAATETSEDSEAATDDADLDENILQSTAEGAAESDYATCTGWGNGGIRCLAKCWGGGNAWYYTGSSYPSTPNGQCDEKADAFCKAHFGTSPRKDKCWGTL